MKAFKNFVNGSHVDAVDGRTTTVEVVLVAEDKPRARATVGAVRVPDSWRQPG